MPAHMQPGQQHAQRGQPGADGQRAHVGHAMPRPAAQPGQAPQPMAAAAAMPQPRPQNTRNTVVHHAPPMQLQVRSWPKSSTYRALHYLALALHPYLEAPYVIQGLNDCSLCTVHVSTAL